MHDSFWKVERQAVPTQNCSQHGLWIIFSNRVMIFWGLLLSFSNWHNSRLVSILLERRQISVQPTLQTFGNTHQRHLDWLIARQGIWKFMYFWFRGELSLCLLKAWKPVHSQTWKRFSSWWKRMLNCLPAFKALSLKELYYLWRAIPILCVSVNLARFMSASLCVKEKCCCLEIHIDFVTCKDWNVPYWLKNKQTNKKTQNKT